MIALRYMCVLLLVVSALFVSESDAAASPYFRRRFYNNYRPTYHRTFSRPSFHGGFRGGFGGGFGGHSNEFFSNEYYG